MSLEETTPTGTEHRIDSNDIIAAIAEGVIVLNHSGTVIFANPAAHSFLRYTPGDLLGRDFHITIHGHQPNGRLSAREESVILATLHDGGTHYVVGEGFWRADGSWLSVEYVATPLKLSEAIVGVVVTFRDIGERLEAEAERAALLEQANAAEAKFRSLLEAAPDAVIITNNRGIITLVNRQAEVTFGYERSEMLGQSIEILMPPRYRLAHLRYRTQYQHDPRTRPMGVGLDLQAQRKDGSVFPVEVSLSPVTLDGEILTISTVRDITERLRAREALQDSEERFRILVHTVEDYAIYLVTAQGIVVSWNAGAERLLGYQEAEAIGQHISAFFPSDGNSCSLAAQQFAIAETAGRAEVEAYIRRRNGSHFFANTIVTVLRDDKQHVRGYAVVTRDLTQQRAAEHERTLLLTREREARRDAEFLAAERAAILDHIADGVITTDQDGMISYINVEAQTLLALTAFPEGARLLAKQQLGHVPEICSLLEQSRHLGKPLSDVDASVLLPSGEKRHLLCSAVPLHRGAGEYAGTVVTLHDITAARTLEREKDEFLANISHDLRTPLGAIRMSIGAILANMPAALDQRLQRLLFTIDGASERMAKLVDDLLELSRLQAGRVHLQLSECDLRELVSQISHTFDPLIEARHQHLELRLPDIPVWVRIDRERIERAVMNLLSNAQKYGRDGGYIRVTLSTEDDQALLAVADNGSGIAPSELARIFDRFYRAGDAALNQGSGLGLPIAKGMAELHGGSLHVSSELGQGSTFTLVLPREINQETSRSAGSGVG